MRIPFGTLLSLLLCGEAVASGLPQYTVVDLGANFPGSSIGYYYPKAINRHGQIVGSFSGSDAVGRIVWFRSSPGKPTPLSGLSDAAAINNEGQIVGMSLQYQACLYSGGTITNLGTLATPASDPYQSAESYATAFNRQGQIVGVSDIQGHEIEGGHEHAFLYSGGVMTDLGAPDVPGSRDSFAAGINDSGEVVGSVTYHTNRTRAFVYAHGQMSYPGTLGGKYSEALAINQAGEFVGDASTKDGATHAFACIHGKMTDLGAPGSYAGTLSTAVAINDQGDIVGESYIGKDSTEQSFLYTGGKMYALDDLLSSPGKWNIISATGINNAGIIVGIGTPNHSHGQHLILLAPLLTLTIHGDKDHVTAGRRLTIRGTTEGGASQVKYRLGSAQPFRTAQGTGSWQFVAKLRPGKNIITVRAVGLAGNATTQRMVVTRK